MLMMSYSAGRCGCVPEEVEQAEAEEKYQRPPNAGTSIAKRFSYASPGNRVKNTRVSISLRGNLAVRAEDKTPHYYTT